MTDKNENEQGKTQAFLGYALCYTDGKDIDTSFFKTLGEAQAKMMAEYKNMLPQYASASGFENSYAYCVDNGTTYLWQISDITFPETAANEPSSSADIPYNSRLHEEVEIVGNLYHALQEAESSGVPMTVLAKKYGFVYPKLLTFLSFAHKTVNEKETECENPEPALTPMERFYAELTNTPKAGYALLALPDGFADRVMETAEQTLSPRSLDIFRRRMEGETLESISEVYSLCRDRVRQIQNKSMRLMHQDARKLYMLYGCDLRAEASLAVEKEIDRTIADAVAKAKEELQQEIGNMRPEQILAKYGEAEENPDKNAEILKTPLDELELSVRSYNCLRRAGCHTLKDVLWLYEIGCLPKVRNLGKKSIREVLAICEALAPGSIADKGDGSGSERILRLQKRCREALERGDIFPPLEEVLDMACVAETTRNCMKYNKVTTTDVVLAMIAAGTLYQLYPYDAAGMMRTVDVCERLLEE